MKQKLSIDGAQAATLKLTEDSIARETPRWLFLASDLPGTTGAATPGGGIHFESRCIVPFRGPHGFMNRCLVTPCVVQSEERIKQEVPEGTTILSGKLGKDLLGRPTDMVTIPVYPGPEVAFLLGSYSSWGLREIQSLRGQTPEQVANYKLNSMFFPNWPFDVPDTNADLAQYVRDQRGVLGKLATGSKTYQQVADEMLAAIEATDQWMRNHVSAVHIAFQIPPNEEGHKSRYDAVDLHFIKRTGMQRRDEDLATLSKTQQLIAELMGKSGGGGITAGDLQRILDAQTKMVMAAMAAQNANQSNAGGDSTFTRRTEPSTSE